MSLSEQKELKDLRKKRGLIKCRLTNFKKYVSSFENVDLDTHQRAELKLRIPGAQSLMNDFNQVQSKIEDLVPESETDKLIESRVEFEREYYVVLAMLDCMVNPDSSEDRSVNKSIDCSLAHDHTTCNNFSNDSVKLPTISVPSFDGSHEHWVEFRDTFSSLIHDSKSIPPIQKFHYLKASLKGDAKIVIENVEFSSNNYLVAWELLLNRFNNTRLIVQSHIKAIFSLQNVSRESACQLHNLIDTILKNLRILKILGEPTEYWDTLIIYIVVSKLDPTTEREWEQFKNTFYKIHKDKIIKLDDLLKFIKEKADLLTTLSVNHSKPSISNNSNKFSTYQNKNSSSKIHCNIVSDNKHSFNSKSQSNKSRSHYKSCLLCNEKHQLYSCQKFLDLSPQHRLNLITDKDLCINCMRPGHSVGTCLFGPCRKCEQKHNSLLCDAIKLSPIKQNTVTLTTYEHPSLTNTHTVSADNAHSLTMQLQCTNHAQTVMYTKDDNSSQQIVILSTAIVEVFNESGEYYCARAVLDSGSERSFITQSLANKLNLRILQSTQHIHGVGNSITQCSQSCNIEIKSRDGSFTARFQCLILPQITSKLPTTTFNFNQFNVPHNLLLADPNCYESQPIDLLIGADLFWELITEGKMRLKSGPFLQNTKLGWIVSGSIKSFPYSNNKNSTYINCNYSSLSTEDDSLDKLVRNFWELEELSAPSNKLQQLSSEDTACEKHFIRTTRRLSDGRFCVSIPLKQSPKLLGNTRAQAERRFYALEKRLQQNTNYKKMYSDFIQEYIHLGHMSLVNSYGNPHYFLPHHGVFREHATTTKLRVVFDASMKSSSGVSLNDIQMIGPAIQGS
ncbi:uncharacterized protein LOC123696951 [Colias croceus]|uniref:uncharacterized protein LOC123696951 n=1 Tax=Colias crocea TaxID=72248 RepID=UPI001E27C6BC|nr:uncharacterized protein LOC123696951 [Colias croceus]